MSGEIIKGNIYALFFNSEYFVSALVADTKHTIMITLKEQAQENQNEEKNFTIVPITKESVRHYYSLLYDKFSNSMLLITASAAIVAEQKQEQDNEKQYFTIASKHSSFT